MTAPTLRRYLTQNSFDPDLVFLLEDIASASRLIAGLVRRGAFEGNLGAAGEINVQGEAQKTLDIMANDVFERECANSARVAALVSEEVEEVTWLKEPQKGDYLLYFDPLDGSSNLDVNLSVGSIFSVMQVQADGDRNVLHNGRNQICAGYARRDVGICDQHVTRTLLVCPRQPLCGRGCRRQGRPPWPVVQHALDRVHGRGCAPYPHAWRRLSVPR